MSTQEMWNRFQQRENARAPRKEVRVGIGRHRGIRLALTGLIMAGLTVTASAKNDHDRKNSNGNQLILRALPADAADIAVQHGLRIAGEHENAAGYLALLEAPESLGVEQVEALLQGDARVDSLSRAELAALPSPELVQPAQEDIAADLWQAGDFSTPCLSQGFSGSLWSGYAHQRAVRDIKLHQGHASNGDCGSAVVAVLDTGFDVDHPLLQGAMLPGYDFVTEQLGSVAEESGTGAGTTVAILEAQSAGSAAAVADGEGQLLILGSVNPLLAGETAMDILDEEDPPAPFYGHGTMIAGLVRLAAPSATILPLKVFDSHGSANVFDIIRAVYYAVDNGADVINMSFSIASQPLELKRAVQYARSNGVACVAAAGNDGEHTQVYPAGFSSAIGVAALDGQELAPFSNYGPNLVVLAAPGKGVISAYPGGLYGAGWGTSFASPLVAGTLALLIHRYPERDVAALQKMENALRKGSETIDPLVGSIGGGRLDVLGTVSEAQE